MLFMESVVNISDNSGIKKVKIIKGINRGKSYLGPGRLAIGSVQKVKPRRKIKKGDLVRVIIFRTKVDFIRLSGVRAYFGSHSAVLLKKTEDIPYGNRVKTMGSIELRKAGFLKILSMSKLVV
jgi:large subunit ribosomal protein L14